MTAKERFLKYVTFHTTSDENSSSCPSTEGQRTLLSFLKEELLAMGIAAEQDENGYVTARIPANAEGLPVLCFLAHVDTSPAVSGENVRPREVVYEGGDIPLGNGVTLSEKDNPDLRELIGETLIVTDGNTLLGADDKAGVAEIVTAAERMVNDPSFRHGEIAIAFTPDEEIGRGTDLFDVEKFAADFGYTVDGGKLGEIEYENFNAAAATIEVKGYSIHPGGAKNRMKNAVDLFCEFHDLLPEADRPVHTENYEGFYMADELSADVEKATCKYIIRDHDGENFRRRKEFFLSCADFLNGKYGEGTFTATVKDSYYNMASVIRENFHLVENARKAMKDCGIEPITVPIRGGTDGARLSFLGLPCPNLSTGGYNFHSRTEFIPAGAPDRMTEVILKIVSLYAERQ